MKLYEVDQAILDCIDEDGEIIDVSAFEALQLERDTKIDNIACWYKQLLAESDAIESEEKILAERKKRKRAQAENLKGYLSRILDGQKFETSRNMITWRSSSSVTVLDESMIPIGFMRLKTTQEPDKTAISEAIKAGVEVPGAEITASNRIQIK